MLSLGRAWHQTRDLRPSITLPTHRESNSDEAVGRVKKPLFLHHVEMRGLSPLIHCRNVAVLIGPREASSEHRNQDIPDILGKAQNSVSDTCGNFRFQVAQREVAVRTDSTRTRPRYKFLSVTQNGVTNLPDYRAKDTCDPRITYGTNAKFGKSRRSLN